MPGDNVIHPIADQWGRYQNWDFCSEVEPTETWSYMTWIDPVTQVLKVRNKEDTDWIAIGGGGGGGPHASTHEDGGSDEIDVAGLSGELADPQPPKLHAADHQAEGADEIDVTGLAGELADPQNAGKLQGRAVASDAPSDGDALIWNAAESKWEPASAGAAGWPYAKVITVDKTDPDADYSTLAAAIAAASIGDIIELGPSTSDYTLPEGNLTKTVVIRGQGPPGADGTSPTRLCVGSGSTTLWDWFVFENLYIWGAVNVYWRSTFRNCTIAAKADGYFFTVSTHPQTSGRVAFYGCKFIGSGGICNMTNSFGKVEFYDCECALAGATTLNHGSNGLVVRDFAWDSNLTISGAGTRTNIGKPIAQAGLDASKGTPIFDGQFYYATDTNKLYIGDGGSWAQSEGPHASTHEDGGSDEISVAGLSGVLADKQDADKLQGRDVDSGAPNDGEVLTWSAALSQWGPKKGGIVPLYDSEWVLSAAGTHTFTHNLGKIPLLWTLLAADDASGTNPCGCLAGDWSDTAHGSGLVRVLTATQLQVDLLATGYAYSGGAGKWYQRGIDYIRLLIWATT